MALFSKLLNTDIPNIDWEMTPEYTFGTFESWGGGSGCAAKTSASIISSSTAGARRPSSA